METNEVSLHRLRVYQWFRHTGGWRTNEDVAEGSGVASRTARAHTKALVDLGVLDVAEVFPAHRYRISEKAPQRNKGYMNRLVNAEEVFGPFSALK